MDDDDEDDVDHVEEEPDVRHLQDGRLGETSDEGGEKRGEHEEAGDGSHEPVVEVLHVNEEGQVHEEPEDEGLEKESDHHRVEDPDQPDVEPEAAALQREVCLGPHLTHFECCQNPFSKYRDGVPALGQRHRGVVLPREVDGAGAVLLVKGVLEVVEGAAVLEPEVPGHDQGVLRPTVPHVLRVGRLVAVGGTIISVSSVEEDIYFVS